MQWVKSQDKLKDSVALVGSWTVNVGDQDQALHLWKFTGGFQQIDVFNQLTDINEVFWLFKANYDRLKWICFRIMIN